MNYTANFLKKESLPKLLPGIVGYLEDPSTGEPAAWAEHKGEGMWQVEMFSISGLFNLGQDPDEVRSKLQCMLYDVVSKTR